MFVKLLISFISFILAVALILGVVFTVREIKDVFSDLSDITNEDSESTDSDTGGIGDSTGNTSTETTQSSTDAFYIDEVNQTGYRTIAGVTYFFKVIKPASNGDSCCYFKIWNGEHPDGSGIKPYGSYTLSLKWSTDSIFWIDERSDEEHHWRFLSGGVGYLCYTTVSGCTNPRVVLEDLNQNVFLNSNIFSYSMVSAAG